VAASHTRAVPSLDSVTAVRPSWVNKTWFTATAGGKEESGIGGWEGEHCGGQHLQCGLGDAQAARRSTQAGRREGRQPGRQAHEPEVWPVLLSRSPHFWSVHSRSPVCSSRKAEMQKRMVAGRSATGRQAAWQFFWARQQCLNHCRMLM
jgi:hypothetical protein